VNSPTLADRLHDPRDVSFALHALIGSSHPDDSGACLAVAAHLPEAPTLDELVDVVFRRRASEGSDADARLKARSLLAVYFAIDPPVDPDPSA
jgi:hypothetical protein